MTAFTGVTATDDFYDAQQNVALYDFRNPTKLGREKVRRLIALASGLPNGSLDLLPVRR